MSTNFIASLLVSTTLLVVSAGTVVLLPDVIAAQNTAEHYTIGWN